MTNGRMLRRVGGTLVVLLLVVLAIPVLTGRPVASFAYSGSMEPTIGTFDVFFVNPWPGDLEKGDIIVFQSVKRSEPAVHRIIDGDETGWYTQGDANPNMDQMAGEPVVTRDRILGEVIVGPDGEPIVIPKLGVTAVELRAEWAKLENKAGGARQLQTYAFLGLAIVLALPVVFSGKRAPPPPSAQPAWMRRALRRAFPRGILGKHVALAVILLFLGASAWAAHSTRAELTTSMVVVTNAAVADDVRAQPPGGVLHRQVQVGSLGLLPTIVLVEAGSSHLEPLQPLTHVGVWERVKVPYDQRAGDAIGHQPDTLVVTRYPALLPEGATVALHEAMPGSPYFVLAGLFSLASIAWLGALGILRAPVGRWLGMREDWL